VTEAPHSLRARWPLACFLILGLFAGTWAALIPDLKRQTGATDGELGVALLFFGIGAIPAMLLTGRIWRSTGWLLLPVAGFLFAVSMLGPSFATSPVALGLAAMFAGAGSGVLDVSMNAAVSDVEQDRGARLMFGAHALFSLGVLVSALSTGLARELGAQPIHALGSVAVITALVAAASIASSRAASSFHAAAAASRGGDTAPSTGVGAAITILAALCAMAFLVEDALQNWSALQIERGLGGGPALGGAAPGVFAGAMFLGRITGQRLGARFSDRTLLSGGSLAASIGAAILALAPSPIVALTGLAVAGAGISTIAPALFARAGRMTDPAGRAAAIARVTSLGYSGFVFGPAIVGIVAQLTDLRSAIVVLSALALLLAASGAFVLRDADRAGTLEEGEELLRTGRV
jgi:predicted MFS family arabinose efflux permease